MGLFGSVVFVARLVSYLALVGSLLFSGLLVWLLEYVSFLVEVRRLERFGIGS